MYFCREIIYSGYLHDIYNEIQVNVISINLLYLEEVTTIFLIRNFDTMKDKK